MKYGRGEGKKKKRRRNKPALCGREQKDDMTKNVLWRVRRRRSRDKEVRVLVVAVPPGAVRGAMGSHWALGGWANAFQWFDCGGELAYRGR